MSEYTIDDLRTLMARLREPETGCPWDQKQTFRSIVPHTLEEAQEVADAIEQEDFPHLKDELGDLLFQVIFYCEMGQEQQHFNFDSVVDNLVRKLLRRHPHVFPDGTLQSRIDPDNRPSEDEIKAQWERIKAAEREALGQSVEQAGPVSQMDGIAKTLPPMARAEKLQRRASNTGFDWTALAPIFDKLQEETLELQEAWEESAQGARGLDRVEDELGDLLFVCVNLARFMKVNPEQALRRTNAKFEARFRAIENNLRERGLEPESQTLEELDRIWQSVKGVENQ